MNYVDDDEPWPILQTDPSLALRSIALSFDFLPASLILHEAHE